MIEPEPTIRAERADAAANRARIIEAAREVFAARGLDAEIKEIAARADVGVGTLYRHFDSREGLLTALIRETRGDLLKRIQFALATESPADAFREMIRAGAEVYERFGALTEVALAGRLEKYGGDASQFTELMASLLRRAVAEGAFRRDIDVPVIVAAIESVFRSGKLVELAAERGYRGAADAFADFFLGACAPNPRPLP